MCTVRRLIVVYKVGGGQRVISTLSASLSTVAMLLLFRSSKHTNKHILKRHTTDVTETCFYTYAPATWPARGSC